MCGGFSIYNLRDPRMKKLVGNDPIEPEPRYNARPMQFLPIITLQDDKPRGNTALWGIKIPIKGRETLLINAKLESLGSPLWKSMDPCLVPANGFFEWQKEKGRSIPYYFTDKNSDLFFMAGLHRDKKFVVLTTAATGAVKRIHHRMPVILEKNKESHWLMGEIPKHVDNLVSARVSDKVNSARNDSEDLIYPIKGAKTSQ